MADPKKTAATSTDDQAPGNGDVWGTLHDKDAPSSEGASSAETPDQAEEAAEVSEEAAEVAADEAADIAADDDLLDAVLEAEAAAIVDNAMDEVRAEAGAEVYQKEAAEWKDKYMRLHAEWDTYRRRQKDQAETQKALAAEKLVSSLIPVIDDLERSIEYATNNGETGLLDGVKAVLNKFVDTLVKDGVEVIDPKGEEFNALEAQAVGTVDDSSQFDETVADVFQKGYKIGNKVLRPAMVTITTGGEARPKETEE